MVEENQIQKSNAGNVGDRLKGTLMNLVLDQCSSWQDFVYSESHSGEGVYQQTDNVDQILDKVAKSNPSENDPGYLYHKLLSNWRSRSENVSYPGSVVQAMLRFGPLQEKVKFRLTEYEKQTRHLLDQNVSPLKGNLIVDIKQASYEDEIPWLTATLDKENKDLVLLLDPFKYSNLDKKFGSIDWPNLKKIIAPCWKKERAVIVLWTKLRGFHAMHENCKTEKFRELSKDSQQLPELLRQEVISHNKNEKLACFFNGDYFVFVLGIGTDGRRIVQKLDERFSEKGTECWWGTVTRKRV